MDVAEIGQILSVVEDDGEKARCLLETAVEHEGRDNIAPLFVVVE